MWNNHQIIESEKSQYHNLDMKVYLFLGFIFLFSLPFIVDVNTNLMVHYGVRPYAIIEKGITYLLLKDGKTKFVKYSINNEISERLEKHIRIKVQKYLSSNIKTIMNKNSEHYNTDFAINSEISTYIQNIPKKFPQYEEFIKTSEGKYVVKMRGKDINVVFYVDKITNSTFAHRFQ